jgi:hypothetical protein
MTAAGLLFEGPAGMLGAAAVKAALGAGVNGNAALLFGRMCSFNGRPFWELRKNLGALFGVSRRTVTRYFRELVDAGLIVNKPAPIGAIHPGISRTLPFRPWYKWAIGLPALREAVKTGSKEAYSRWRDGFEVARKERATRSKLGAIIGSIVAGQAPTTRKTPSSRDEERPRRWSREEIDAALSREPSKPPAGDTS